MVDKQLDSGIINELVSRLTSFMNAQERNSRIIKDILDGRPLTNEQIKEMLTTAQQGTIEYKYLETLTSFKASLEKNVLEGDIIGTSGIDKEADRTRNIRIFVEDFFADKQLNATTELALVGHFYPDNSNITPNAVTSAMSKDLGVKLDTELYKEIWDKQGQRIEHDAKTNTELKSQAELSRLLIDNPSKRASLLFNGKSTEDDDIINDHSIAAELKRELDARAMFASGVKARDKSKESKKEKAANDKIDSDFVVTGLEMHDLDDVSIEERKQYYEHFQTARTNILEREISTFNSSAKAATIDQLTCMCRVLGISRDQIMAQINKLAGSENDVAQSEFWADIQGQLGSTDKKTRKEYVRNFGKTIDEKDKLPVDSKFFSQAVRECIIEKSRRYVESSKSISETLENEKRTLQCALGEAGQFPFARAAQSKLDKALLAKINTDKGLKEMFSDGEELTEAGLQRILNDERVSATFKTELKKRGLTRAMADKAQCADDTQKFITTVYELAERQIPDIVFQLMKTNRKLQDGIEDASKADVVFEMLTSGSIDTKVLGLEKQLRDLYKDRGIDFDTKIGHYENGKPVLGKETLGGYINQMFARYAQRYATAYMNDVAAKSKKKGKEAKEYRADANTLFDATAVKDQTGAEIKPANSSSKTYHPPVNKPPYRALALAMKMINQLARMMCASFQKTIGAGGFYKGMDQDSFNKMVGFGQRLEDRKKDLLFFFYGGVHQGKEVRSGGLDLSGKDGSQFKQLCDELRIKADKQNLDNIIKDDPARVEEAMNWVDGLGKAFSEWRDEAGIENLKKMQYEAENKFENQRKENQQDAESSIKDSNDKTKRVALRQLQINRDNGKLTEEQYEEELFKLAGYDPRVHLLEDEEGKKDPSSAAVGSKDKTPDEKRQVIKHDAQVAMLHIDVEIYRLENLLDQSSKYSLSDTDKEAIKKDIKNLKTIQGEYERALSSAGKAKDEQLDNEMNRLSGLYTNENFGGRKDDPKAGPAKTGEFTNQERMADLRKLFTDNSVNEEYLAGVVSRLLYSDDVKVTKGDVQKFKSQLKKADWESNSEVGKFMPFFTEQINVINQEVAERVNKQKKSQTFDKFIKDELEKHESK